jgi:peptidyl-prolyl cis-trans isomerase B (cyclophilin B)
MSSRPGPAGKARSTPRRLQRHASTRAATARASKRALLAATLLAASVSAAPLLDTPAAAAAAAAARAPKVNDKIYLDVGLCPEGMRTNRAIGNKSALCPDAAPLGRLVFGLYGEAAPGTVARFKQLLNEGIYNGTIFHKARHGSLPAFNDTRGHRSCAATPIAAVC